MLMLFVPKRVRASQRAETHNHPDTVARLDHYIVSTQNKTDIYLESINLTVVFQKTGLCAVTIHYKKGFPLGPDVLQ